MPDRRTVDELSIEELEQLLRIKKREARLARLDAMSARGRRPSGAPLPDEQTQQASTNAAPIPFRSVFDDAPQRRRRDKLLLGVEMAAAAGLIAVLAFAGLQIRQINLDAAEAQAAELAAMPTASPTPLIGAVVLPGGHTPPISPQGAQPNYDEVPESLRPLVEQQFAGPLIVPTAAPGTAVRIRIPAIGVDAPIVQGDGWEQLQKGVGQHLGSAAPGTPGNVVLSAHNDIYGEIFRHLDRLQAGDEIIVHTLTRQHTYRYLQTRVVEPTEVSVLEQTSEAIVTLISCYPYLVNTQRIVIVAELEG